MFFNITKQQCCCSPRFQDEKARIGSGHVQSIEQTEKKKSLVILESVFSLTILDLFPGDSHIKHFQPYKTQLGDKQENLVTR